ncbi:HNH endonuclease [Paenibacillus sp. PL91]|uniref:HNH endonuclease n=1 Tax=Paenibacillus sp. PL91 TaxID=2729538 RepID=UPI00145D820C|nr:HNH endonuclease [Paenibacillus sp. PL91]MBC9203324.1 HNH endonuclease [Paenibacillus sp. PL91]
MGAIKDKMPTRSHTGIMWRTNTSNKSRLAVDFDHKCAYCDDKDIYSGGYNSYHVEHFAPKEKFRDLEFTYDNLLYSCPYCNIAKSDKWVGGDASEAIVGDKGFIDPCTDEYYTHLERDENGNIKYISPIGEYIYFELKLYLKRHYILYNLEKVRVKRNAIKKEIDRKAANGADVGELTKVHHLLCAVFCEYFDLIYYDK